jgi:hypothetical protein
MQTKGKKLLVVAIRFVLKQNIQLLKDLYSL